jgi:hypothetical protein
MLIVVETVCVAWLADTKPLDSGDSLMRVGKSLEPGAGWGLPLNPYDRGIVPNGPSSPGLRCLMVLN